MKRGFVDPHADTPSRLLCDIARLGEEATTLGQHRADPAEHAAAEHRLQIAVDAARDAAIGWTDIGAALGMRRGNAYQRFRRRRPPSSGSGAAKRSERTSS